MRMSGRQIGNIRVACLLQTRAGNRLETFFLRRKKTCNRREKKKKARESKLFLHTRILCTVYTKWKTCFCFGVNLHTKWFATQQWLNQGFFASILMTCSHLLFSIFKVLVARRLLSNRQCAGNFFPQCLKLG